MPSSRVFSLLVGSVVLLGSTAGAFAVGSPEPTAASSPQAANDAGDVVPSSPSADDAVVENSDSDSEAPSGTVATDPLEESSSGGTGSASNDESATGSSGGGFTAAGSGASRSEKHTSELQSRQYLVCSILLE